MKNKPLLLFIGLLILSILSCSLPAGISSTQDEAPEAEAPEMQPEPAEALPGAPAAEGEGEGEGEGESPPETAATRPVTPPTGDLLQPEDLVYLGAFRLPDESGGSNWDYSGHGLTSYPGGDPAGAADGFPGSLFGVGHDQQLHVSEVSIPEPVISKNPEDLNTAATLQDFHDITGGLVTENLALPRLGLEYMPPMGSQTTAKLHFSLGQHIQDFEPSHGWSELDLSKPRPAGPWVFDGYSNYTTNDYLFEIPEAWAAAYTPGMRLASGRFREGVWAGRGPVIYAYAPWNDGDPPKPKATLSSITPLLLYGIQEPGLPDIVSDETMQMNSYQESDHWWGAAWLTAGDKSAVVFTGTKALGKSWYGFSNGVVWEYDCAEQTPPTCPDLPEWPDDNRGYWAEGYQAQIIFFNPNDLAKVAQGDIETFDPQPYASLDINPYMLDPELDHAEYKRDIIGAAAFDRANGLLYIIERLADEYKSVIHVWRVGG